MFLSCRAESRYLLLFPSELKPALNIERFFHFSRNDKSSAVQFRKLAPDFALAFRQLLGNLHLNRDIQITAFSSRAGKTAFTKTKPLTALSAGGHFEPHRSFQGRNSQFSAEYRLPRRDLFLVDQITAFDRELRMLRQPNAKKEIAAFTAARSCLTLTGQPNLLTFVDATRDFHLIGFDFVRSAAPQRHCSG